MIKYITRFAHSACSLYKKAGRLLVMLVLMPLSLSVVQAAVLGFVEFEGDEDNNTSPGYFTRAVLESPDGRFVYSISRVNARLNAYSRDIDTGMITLVQSLQNSGDYGLRSVSGMAISPDGKYIYVTGITDRPFDQSISWFIRNSTSGKLAYSGKILQAEDISAGYTNPNGELRISPDGFFLYAGDRSGQVVVFRRASNGVLRYVQTFSDPGRLNGLRGFTISPDGKNLYTVSDSAQTLNVFTRNILTGELTATQTISDIHRDATAGITGLENVEDIIVSADGRFVYVTGKIENDTATTDDDEYAVLIFFRSASDGTLTYQRRIVNTVAFADTPEWDTLQGASSLAFSADTEQKFLYVATQDAINVLRRNPVDGSLSWLGWETEGVNGVSNLQSVQKIIVTADGRHIYAALGEGDGISVFDTRADLSVVMSDSTDPVQPNGNFSYTLSVTNNGPADAFRVVLTNVIPQGIRILSATTNKPGTTCVGTGVTVGCNLGMIANTDVVNTVIEVRAPLTASVITNSASVSAEPLDTEIANNTDTEATCVDINGGTACSGEGGATAPVPSVIPPSSSTASGGGGSLDIFWLLLMTGLLVLCIRQPGKAC